MALTLEQVQEIYAPLASGDWDTFMSRVRDDVSWRVGNSMIKSFPVAGTHNKKEFLAAFQPWTDCFPSGLTLQTVNVELLGGGHGAMVEMIADAVAKDGTVVKNFYCWVNEFDESSPPMIKTVRAYLDTAIVKTVMERNGVQTEGGGVAMIHQ